MNKVSTIKGSAQARLLLYRLLSTKLTDVEHRLLASDPSLWDALIEVLERTIDSDAVLKSDQKILAEVFFYIDHTTKEGLQKQISRLTGQNLWLGIDATGLLGSFIEEHQKLIKSVQREHLDKISLVIKRGIREGRLQKDIAKDIRQMTDMSKRRAQLIARNAPLQYSGALTKHHQMNAGIKSYIWQSSRDERVRDSHRKLDGEIFNWDGAGPHPRSEVNCRCDAVPVLD
jgi:SPP1 gp7 family putative phage head morphogenesis protein